MTYKILILGDAGTGKTSLRTQYLYQTFSFQYKSTIGANFVTKEVRLATLPISVRARQEESNDSINQSFHSVQNFWPGERNRSGEISESPSMSSLRTIKEEKISLCLWDTAGQERFNALAPTFYRGADGAVLVYDIMDAQSLRSIAAHHAAFLKHSGTRNPVIVVVGNKLDTAPQVPRPVFGAFSESRVTDREIEKMISILRDQTREHAKTMKFYSKNGEEDIIEAMQVSAKLGTNVDPVFMRIAQLCLARSKSSVQVEAFDVDETIDISERRRGSNCC